MVEGSVRCSPIPVSPVTPFNVIDWVFPVGGRIVHAVGVVPPVGTVMVLRPEARVLISITPGLAALVAATMLSVPVRSPLYTIVVVLMAETLILSSSRRRSPR
jgi:hypothetical protein